MWIVESNDALEEPAHGRPCFHLFLLLTTFSFIAFLAMLHLGYKLGKNVFAISYMSNFDKIINTPAELHVSEEPYPDQVCILAPNRHEYQYITIVLE